MQINVFWLIVIIVGSIPAGFGLCFLYILNTLKKTLGIKSWKGFLKQVQKQQELSKKMKGKGLNEMLNDPEVKKQLEQFRKKFGNSK